MGTLVGCSGHLLAVRRGSPFHVTGARRLPGDLARVEGDPCIARLVAPARESEARVQHRVPIHDAEQHKPGKDDGDDDDNEDDDSYLLLSNTTADLTDLLLLGTTYYCCYLAQLTT